MRKLLLTIGAIVLFLAIYIPLKLFFIGEPVDGTTLACEVTNNGEELRVSVCTPASAIALRGRKFRQKGSALYISARKVLVSRFCSSGGYTTTIRTDAIEEIYLGGRVIWQK